MDLENILNIDCGTVLKDVSAGGKVSPKPEKYESGLVHNVPCYFSKDQIELYEKVIQLHYSDILQLINKPKNSEEISDLIKNSMDLLAINLESVSIHPYVLIMSKLPNSNRQLVFKEFVKSQLLAKSGKLQTLKMLIDNFRENKKKRNIIVYCRGDFNINELYDFEKTNYKHLSYIPGDINQEYKLRRNTVSDIKAELSDVHIKHGGVDEDEEIEEDNVLEDAGEENISNSEEEPTSKSQSAEKDVKTKEDNIQNTMYGRSSTVSLSSTTQQTRICDILEAVLTTTLTQTNLRKMVVKRYDGKKPLKRGTASSADEANRNDGNSDALYVHLVSNMETVCKVNNADLIISLDSTYPFQQSLQNVEGLRLYTPFSIDQFLMLKEKNGEQLESVVMNVVCNKDKVGSLTDAWTLEYLGDLKNVASSTFSYEPIETNFTVGNKELTERILHESGEVLGDFLQSYVDGLDSGDSIFNFLRFIDKLDPKINFAQLSDTDLVNVRKLVKNRVFASESDRALGRNNFKINKNLVINFDQRILYQLNRGEKVTSCFENKDVDKNKNVAENSLLFEKMQSAKKNLEISIALNTSIEKEITFYEQEFNNILQKITVDGFKFTEDANQEIQKCLSRQTELREEISALKMRSNESSGAKDLVLLKKKLADKKNEGEYLAREITRAKNSSAESEAEILAVQKKIEEMDNEIEKRRLQNNSLKRKIDERKETGGIISSDKFLDEATRLYVAIQELPLKRTKRQRRR